MSIERMEGWVCYGDGNTVSCPIGAKCPKCWITDIQDFLNDLAEFQEDDENKEPVIIGCRNDDDNDADSRIQDCKNCGITLNSDDCERYCRKQERRSRYDFGENYYLWVRLKTGEVVPCTIKAVTRYSPAYNEYLIPGRTITINDIDAVIRDDLIEPDDDDDRFEKLG